MPPCVPCPGTPPWVHPSLHHQHPRTLRAGTVGHGPSAGRARAPGLSPEETRGWENFWALGSPEVSFFLCSAAQDPARSPRGKIERLDSARGNIGAGGSGRLLGASGTPDLTVPWIRHHPEHLPASEAGAARGLWPRTLQSFRLILGIRPQEGGYPESLPPDPSLSEERFPCPKPP